jgi:hypothetical protein
MPSEEWPRICSSLDFLLVDLGQPGGVGDRDGQAGRERREQLRVAAGEAERGAAEPAAAPVAVAEQDHAVVPALGDQRRGEHLEPAGGGPVAAAQHRVHRVAQQPQRLEVGVAGRPVAEAVGVVDGAERAAHPRGEQQARLGGAEQPRHPRQHHRQHVVQDQRRGEGLADLVEVLEAVALLGLAGGGAVGQVQGGQRQQHGRQHHRGAQPQRHPDEADRGVAEEGQGGGLGRLADHLGGAALLHRGDQLADQQEVEQREAGDGDGHGGHAARRQRQARVGHGVVQRHRRAQRRAVHAGVEQDLDRLPPQQRLGEQQPGEGDEHGRARREQGGVGHQHGLVQRQRLQRALVAQPQPAQLRRGGEGEQDGQLARLPAAEAARLDRHHRRGGGRAGHHHHENEAPEPGRQHRRRGASRHPPRTRLRRGLDAGPAVVTTGQVRACPATGRTRAAWRRAQVRPALGTWRAGVLAGGRRCGRRRPAPRWGVGGGTPATVTRCTG